MTSWIDQGLGGCECADARLAKRFRTLVEQRSEGIGETIPMACQDYGSALRVYPIPGKIRRAGPDYIPFAAS